MIKDERPHLRQFIDNMDLMIKEYAAKDGRSQKELYNRLIACEKEFRDALMEDEEAQKMCVAFSMMITTERGNILASQIYFRERQTAFNTKISPAIKRALKNGNISGFKTLKANYSFVRWVMEHINTADLKYYNTEHTVEYSKRKRMMVPKQTRIPVITPSKISRRTHDRLKEAHDEIIELRESLCKTAMALGINKAMQFKRKVPKAHMDDMDFVESCMEGLLTAIDKWSPPYRDEWRSSAITRMLERMMTDYNSTLLKMAPREKRILYRSNNAIRKEKMTDIDEITTYVQQSFKNTSAEEILQIRAAQMALSIDRPPEEGETEEEVSYYSTLPEEEVAPEEVLSLRNMKARLARILPMLSLIEAKVLCLKYGMDMPDAISK